MLKLAFALFVFMQIFSCIAEEKEPEKKTQKNSGVYKNKEDFFTKKPFFKIAPLVITIFDNDKIYGTIRIDSIIETDPEKWQNMRLKMPLFFDALFVDLYQSLNYLWDRSRPPDYKVLKRRFQLVSDRIFGKCAVKNVMIGLVLVNVNAPKQEEQQQDQDAQDSKEID